MAGMRESTAGSDLRDSFHLLELEFDLMDVKSLPSYQLALVHLCRRADELHKLTASNEFLRRRERERRHIGVFEAKADEDAKVDPVLVLPVTMVNAEVQTDALPTPRAAPAGSRPPVPSRLPAVTRPSRSPPSPSSPPAASTPPSAPAQTTALPPQKSPLLAEDDRWAVLKRPVVGTWASSSSASSTPTVRARSPGTPPLRPQPPASTSQLPAALPARLTNLPNSGRTPTSHAVKPTAPILTQPAAPAAAPLATRPSPTLYHAPVSLTDHFHLVWLGGLSSLCPPPSLVLLRHHLTRSFDAPRPVALAWGRDTRAYALAAYRSDADARSAVGRTHGVAMPGTSDVLVANRPGGTHRFRASELAKGVLSRWLQDGVVPELREWDQGGVGYKSELERCRTEAKAKGLVGRVEGLADGSERERSGSAGRNLLEHVQALEHDFPFAFPFAPSPVGSPAPENGKRAGEGGDWVEQMKRAKMAS